MKILEAKAKALDLIAQYKLDDYRFEFDNAISRFGYCNSTSKIISLSTSLVELNTEEAVIDTILHEIAHALTPGCAHNEVWQRVAKGIGSSGTRCYDSELTETPTYKWIAKCPQCGDELKRHKKNKNLYCSDCYKKNNNRLNKKFKFKWIKL